MYLKAIIALLTIGLINAEVFLEEKFENGKRDTFCDYQRFFHLDSYTLQIIGKMNGFTASIPAKNLANLSALPVPFSTMLKQIKVSSLN